MSVIAHAADLLERVREDPEFDPTELSALATRCRAESGQLSPEDGQQLYALLREIEIVVMGQQQQTQRELLGVKSGKRALRGYGHLKSHRRCQNIATQA